FGRTGAGIFYAAVVIATVYGMVHLDRIAVNVASTPGRPAISPHGLLANPPRDLSVTETLTFGLEGSPRRNTLETYWSNGKLYYRARYKTSRQMFEKATSCQDLGAPEGPTVAMVYSLRNRFGEELLCLQIPVGKFQRDMNDPDFVVAAGSAHLEESAYR